MFQKITNTITLFFLKRKIQRIERLMKKIILDSVEIDDLKQKSLLKTLLTLSIEKAIVGLCITFPPKARNKFISFIMKQVKEKIKELDKK